MWRDRSLARNSANSATSSARPGRLPVRGISPAGYSAGTSAASVFRTESKTSSSSAKPTWLCSGPRWKEAGAEWSRNAEASHGGLACCGPFGGACDSGPARSTGRSAGADAEPAAAPRAAKGFTVAPEPHAPVVAQPSRLPACRGMRRPTAQGLRRRHLAGACGFADEGRQPPTAARRLPPGGCDVEGSLRSRATGSGGGQRPPWATLARERAGAALEGRRPRWPNRPVGR